MNTTLHLYVSPAGNDQWSGRRPEPGADGTDGPCATLAGARDAIRRARSQTDTHGPITVEVAAGFYELAEPLLFTPADGGTATAPIRYVAASGAAPIISGGRVLAGWRETEHSGQRCWTLDLPEVAAGDWDFSRLYVNQAPRPRPRLPKSGFHHFTGAGNSGGGWCKGPDRASFAPGDIKSWKNWQDVELISYELWFDTHHRIRAIDEATGTVTFHAPSLGTLKDERGAFARYFVENVFEALDTPGEWYLDRPAGRLYYLPLPGETLEETTVVAPRLTELLRLQGENGSRVGHLHFEHLTFAHQHWELPRECPGYIQAAWGVPGAILLAGAEACAFYGCTVTHVNGYGMEVLAGSTRNLIAACTIHDAGGGGIKLGHEQLLPHESPVGARQSGDCPPLATTVVDCTIRDCGHIFPSAIGIWVGNSGWNRLLHNRIFNCNYTGISCGWTWGYAQTRTVSNRIENNHIHHINHRQILSDNGGIYTLGRQPGATVCGNVIHDIACYGYGGWGIYPDEGSSGIRFESNLVRGTQKAAFSTHYGRDNLVRYNIFAGSQAEHVHLGRRERHRSAVCRHNLIVTANGRLRQRGDCPAHYTIGDNLFWALDGTPPCLDGKPVPADAGTVADPLFADAEGGDFSLRPDSPAFAIGFQPFDWRAAGPRFGVTRPGSLHDYLDRHPLPPEGGAAVEVLIEATSIPADGAPATATFTVTLTNHGTAPGRGRLRLAGGPAKSVGTPSLEVLAFDLAPGETQVETVTLPLLENAAAWWLDSVPEDDATVPVRGLALASAATGWELPWVAATTPEEIHAALSAVPAHEVRAGNRTVAEIALGAHQDGLLVFARLHDATPMCNLNQPWKGTALEWLAPGPRVAPGEALSPRRHLVLTPLTGGRGAAAFNIPPPNGVEPAPEVIVDAWPCPEGSELAAFIPWSRLSDTPAPAELAVEMVVDVHEPISGQMMQTCVFDPPSIGSTAQMGCLRLEPPSLAH